MHEMFSLNHISLASFKLDIGNQRRHRTWRLIRVPTVCLQIGQLNFE